MSALFLAGALALPACAASPHPAPVRKAEPRRVVEYRPNRPITHDTDLLSESGYAAWMIDELLLATTPLPRLGAAFTLAERDTGINARYLVAHAILETGWGTSWIAQKKHNLFGYGAYDRDPLRYSIRFPSFAAGIAAVSDRIRAAYLSPDGRWWRGFPTLRGVNRFYASDALWAEKVAVLANVIDGMVVTLRERALHFGWPRVAKPAPGAAVPAGSSVVIEIPWTSRTLGLPAAIRFAFRWAPVALAEGDPTPPAGLTTSTWTPVRRITRAGHVLRVSIATPTLPGSWRLVIEARDSDGRSLPATDAPPIRPLSLHVAAPTEATISLGLDVTPPVADARGVTTVAIAMTPSPESEAGGLVATIRNVGRSTIPTAAKDGTPTLVEAWSLPLAADGVAVLLAQAPLPADLPSAGQLTLRLPPPTGPAVVVVRLSGDPGVIGRSAPAIVLFQSSPAGGATLTQLTASDLRDDLPGSSAPGMAPAPAATLPVPAGPDVDTALVTQTEAVGEVAIGLQRAQAPTAQDAPAEQPEPPGEPPSILVRTLSTLPADTVEPTAAFLPWPGDRAPGASATYSVAGVPAGIRLVIVALVPDGSSAADPATLRLAWVPVARPGPDETPR